MMSGSGARYGGKTYELFIKGRMPSSKKVGEKIADNCQALEPRSCAGRRIRTFTEADAGKALQLKVGQTVHFKLPSPNRHGLLLGSVPESPDLQLQFGPQSAVTQPGAPAEPADRRKGDANRLSGARVPVCAALGEGNSACEDRAVSHPDHRIDLKRAAFAGRTW